VYGESSECCCKILYLGCCEKMGKVVSDGSEDLWTAVFPNATGVLTKDHVAHPVKVVLDRPVRAVQFQEAFGIGFTGFETRDPVGCFPFYSTIGEPTFALDLEYLGDARPSVQILGQCWCRCERSFLNATVSLVCGGAVILLSSPEFLLIGGKNSPIRRTWLRCRSAG
jgi:hypothetical protein